jgi:hypothetical protein
LLDKGFKGFQAHFYPLVWEKTLNFLDAMLFLSLPTFTLAIAFSAEHPSKASKEWNGKVSGMGGERYRQEAGRPRSNSLAAQHIRQHLDRGVVLAIVAGQAKRDHEQSIG